MKVFTAALVTETNTFVPIPTGREDFDLSEPPDESGIFGPGFGIVRDAAQSRGYEMVRSIGAFAMPSGPTARTVYEELRDRILSDLRAAMPVEAVTLALHGAMVADGYDDCEGDTLTRVREIVGSQIPIGVSLDPHAHLSETMAEMADVMVFYKEWPHVDIVESIRAAAHLTIDVAEGRYTPHIAVYDCRMIQHMNTFDEPMKSIVAEVRAMEGTDGVLNISFVHGYSRGDVADMGSKVVVTTNDRREKGAALAEQLGRRLFELRGTLGRTYLNLEEGLDAMERTETFPLVVADAADMPGGGAPGDATFLLRGLIERGITDVAAVYQWDPMAVAVAMKAGAGARLPLRIGGKSGPTAGDPLDVEVEVLRTFDNLVVRLEDREEEVGPVAVVRTHGIDIALETKRTVAWDWAHFEACGVDPRNRRHLIVKSSNNHYAGYLEIAGDYVFVSAPGACNMRVTDYEFKHLQRPKWPLDDEPFG
jgi:microcystin degradation protein MlrC